jgi:hypothetical protein
VAAGGLHHKNPMGEASMKHDRYAQAPQDNTVFFGCDESVVLRLDQLETPGKCSVIYEIARIDTLLGQIFLQDLKCRLAASA